MQTLLAAEARMHTIRAIPFTYLSPRCFLFNLN